MASICLQPPSPFEFRNLEEWPCWKQRFEQFHLVPGLSAEDDDKQVSTLLYCIRDNAEDTFTSTDIYSADWKRYTDVITRGVRLSKNVVSRLLPIIAYE